MTSSNFTALALGAHVTFLPRFHSSRQQTRASVTFFAYTSYSNSLNLVLIMHSLLSHPRFFKEPINVKFVTVSQLHRSKRVHSSIRPNDMRSSQKSFLQKSPQSFSPQQYDCSLSTAHSLHFHSLRALHSLNADKSIAETSSTASRSVAYSKNRTNAVSFPSLSPPVT